MLLLNSVEQRISIYLFSCLMLCLLLFPSVSVRADVVISSAATGTNGSITYPANSNPLAPGEALMIEAGGSITTTGIYDDWIYGDDYGIYGIGSNDITVYGSINTLGRGANGIQVSDNSVINMASTINLSGEGKGDVYDRPSFIPPSDDGLIVIWDDPRPDSYGIHVGNNNQIDISGTVNITGDGAKGIYADSGNTLSLSGEVKSIGSASDGVVIISNNSIDISGGISTEAKGANGIYADENNHISVSGSITTQGNYADAIIALYENDINVSGTITTTGEYAYGLYTGRGTDINMSGTITTSAAPGKILPGIYNYRGNLIDISGTVNTSNSEGIGVEVYYADTLDISGTINGAISTGHIDIIDISGSVISSSNWGIDDEDSNRLNISGNISTSGDYGAGVSTSGTLDMSGTISTTGYQSGGLMSTGATNVSGTVQTLGEWSYGILAGHSLTVSGRVSTSGDKSVGIYSGGLALPGTVTTSGIEAHGIVAYYDGLFNISGNVSTTGEGAAGIYLQYGGNCVHLSGSVSATGLGAYALHSKSMGLIVSPWDDPYQPVEENVFHFLNGALVTGDIYNSDDGGTAYLTFGYAKNEDGTADLTAVDSDFSVNLNGSITSSSEGRWDGYFAGGSTGLNGTSNQFRNLFIGGLTFDEAGVPDGSGGTTDLIPIDGAAANLTVTQAIFTDGTVYIGKGSTYVLSGIHTHTGPNVFLDGTLRLNSGTFLNHAVNTGSNTGSFVNNSVLTVTRGQTGRIEGNYTQTQNGSLVLEAAGTSDYGKLMVTGSADFSESNTLTIELPIDSTLKENDVLEDVVTAGTLITDPDSFSVDSNSAMRQFIPYIDNDTIDLIYKSRLNCLEAISGASSISNPLAAEAAQRLDQLFQAGTGNSDMQYILNTLGRLDTNDKVGQAVAQMVPALAGAGSQIGFDLAINGATQAVDRRLAGFSGMSAGDVFFEDRMAWIKPYYSRTEQSERNGIDGYTANTYGIVIGADSQILSTWQLGAALSYGSSDVESDSLTANQTLDIETYQATLYSNNEIADALTLNLIGALGFNRNESNRRIIFGGVNRNASATYDSWHMLLDGELIKTYDLNEKFSLGASFKVQYVYLDVEGYTETGAGGLNLSVEDSDADSLVASIGGRCKYAVASNQNLTVHADVGYDFLTDASSLVSSYAGGGTAFTIHGNSPSEIVYRGGIGYELLQSTGFEIGIRYRMEAREDFINHTGDITFRLPF
nr:autotransporter domain-containing protein [uncultured Desulfobacter sp.]